MRRVVRYALLAIRHAGARRGRGTRGQSLTELALILPVFILIILIGLDVGRAFLGWVGLQQAARIAANYASLNPTAWDTPGNAQKRNTFKDLIENEAQDIDWSCHLPNRGSLPDPEFTAGNTDVGSPAKVTLTCEFGLATPLIAALLPNPLTLGSSASFPIRNGPLPGQAAGAGNVPNSTFTYSPGSPMTGQTVQFFDASTNTPTGWSWNFGDGTTATTQFPSHVFTCATGTCPFTVTLAASNIHGTDQTPALQTINVQSSTPAPLACFTPTTGTYLAPVSVTFTDCSQNAPYSWSWDFGDGSSPVTGTSAPATTSHIFQCSTGTCVRTVTLTITNGVDPQSQVQHSPYTFNTQYCSTPNFVNMSVKTQTDLNAIQALWSNAGFHDINGNSTNVSYNPSTGLPAGSGNHKVTSQTISGTQPCTALVTLRWS